MSFMTGLRIFTVVMMGWVAAHAAATVLRAVVGGARLAPRALLGEVLTGIGAVIIGLGLLPGGSSSSETTMMIVGCLVWAVGATIEPARPEPGV